MERDREREIEEADRAQLGDWLDMELTLGFPAWVSGWMMDSLSEKG